MVLNEVPKIPQHSYYLWERKNKKNPDKVKIINSEHLEEI